MLGQGRLRVESLVVHSKFQGYGLSVLEKKIFKGFKIYGYDDHLDHLHKLPFPQPRKDLYEIGPMVSEETMFENVD